MAGTLWIGTRKGLFALRADGARRNWKLAGPQFLGHIIHHVVQDPRAPRVLLLAAKTGHLGPTVFRSTDRGRSWREAARPPAFRQVNDGEEARAVQRVFWLTPGHHTESATWYAGSSPAGLFRSTDGGEHWEPVAGFNDHPMRPKWAAFGTPDGEFLHSVLVDPRDPRHLYIAISIGGVFESTDAGGDWTPLNEGCAADFLPDPSVPFGHEHTAWCSTPPDPSGSTSRITAASTAWMARSGAGSASEKPCPRRSAISASRSCCIRPIPTRPGYCPWTARACGRAPPSAADRRSTAPAMVAPAGGAWIAGYRSRKPGSRCCVRPCAPILTRARACISAPPGEKSGPAPAAGTVGAASRTTCRRSTP